MKRGGPIGPGWEETALPEGSAFRQWTYPGGLTRREFADYKEIIFPNGRKEFSGDAGGILIIDGKGGAEVFWNYAAAVASAHASGNRKNPPTFSRGKRQPPAFAEHVAFVAAIRGAFIVSGPSDPDGPSTDIPGLPADSGSPEARDIVQRHSAEAFRLLSAVVRGDADELERIAAAVRLDDEIQRGALWTPKKFEDIANAIRRAAVDAGDLPRRLDVTREYEVIAAGRAVDLDIREDLGRMGFGWLPAPAGKQPRKPGTKGG